MNPWKAPESDARAPTGRGASGSRLGAALALVGLLGQSAIVYGIGEFAFRVNALYDTTDDPKLVAQGIQDAAMPLLIWVQVGTIGLALTVVAVLGTRYRSRWLLWSSLAFSLLYLLVLPVGTLVALALLVAIGTRRREFLGR